MTWQKGIDEDTRRNYKFTSYAGFYLMPLFTAHTSFPLHTEPPVHFLSFHGAKSMSPDAILIVTHLDFTFSILIRPHFSICFMPSKISTEIYPLFSCNLGP